MLRIFLILLALCNFTPVLAASDRFAIVIGNANYLNDPLSNPINDAREMTATLRDAEFETELLENASRMQMEETLISIRTKFTPDRIGLFYFAGHALQHRGVNYLLPVDYIEVSAKEVQAHALRLDDVLAAIHGAGVRLAIIILDACRDNPFGKPEEALGPGLAVLQGVPGETLIAYATSAGTVALDGAGANSPFTAALVSVLQRPGLGIYDVFRQVRTAVREATEGRQIPWIAASLETDFVFREHILTELPGRDSASLMSVYWQTISSSRNPLDYARFCAAGQRTFAIPTRAGARHRRSFRRGTALLSGSCRCRLSCCLVRSRFHVPRRAGC